MNIEQKMVTEFHRKYGCPVGNQPNTMNPKDRLRRVRLITCEAAEFADAADRADLIAMVDALADLLYVTYGTAVEMGVDLAPIFREVHRSNMTKDGGMDAGGKVTKGGGYSPPELDRIVRMQIVSASHG